MEEKRKVTMDKGMVDWKLWGQN